MQDIYTSGARDRWLGILSLSCLLLQMASSALEQPEEAASERLVRLKRHKDMLDANGLQCLRDRTRHIQPVQERSGNGRRVEINAHVPAIDQQDLGLATLLAAVPTKGTTMRKKVFQPRVLR